MTKRDMDIAGAIRHPAQCGKTEDGGGIGQKFLADHMTGAVNFYHLTPEITDGHLAVRVH